MKDDDSSFGLMLSIVRFSLGNFISPYINGMVRFVDQFDKTNVRRNVYKIAVCKLKSG